MVRLLLVLVGGLMVVGIGACARTPDELKIVYDDGNGTVATWTVICGDPPSGTHPDPAAACAALARNGDTALQAVPADRICTQIYGGPQTARITGSWGGDPIDARLNRHNGCEIARWNALRGLLPAAN